MGEMDIHNEALDRLESEHAEGISSQSILDTLSSLGVRFSEATLRKWVQLGLLPRSVRVGRKGKHSGSQGMYPATILRQILRIKGMMSKDLTIEQIQREVLFVRADIAELERSLSRIFLVLEDARQKVDSQTVGYSLAQDLGAARFLADELVRKLNDIEARLISRASASPSVGPSRIATG
jgi:hypothetical protein